MSAIVGRALPGSPPSVMLFAVTTEPTRGGDPSDSVAALLRILVSAGLLLVLAGAVLAFVRDGGLPVGSVPPAEVPAAILRLDAAAISTLGILVLLATPPIALVWIWTAFVRGGDRLFSAVVAGLLALIALGLVAASFAGAGDEAEILARPSPLRVLGVLGAAAASGALGVQVGLGGAAFLVPILSGFFGVPMKLAIGAGAVSVVVNSIVGSSSYLRDRLPNIRLGLLLELPTIVGAIAGGLAVVVVGPDVLRGVFATVLLGLAASIVMRPKGREPLRDGPDPLALRGAYHDRASGEDVTYVPQRIGLGAWAGLAGGTVSGMLGLAGGVIKMPVMHSIMRMPVKAAAATSVLMGGFTVSASAYIYYVHGIIDLSIAIPAILGIQLGSRTGARISRSLSGAALERLLAVVLTGFGVVLVLQLLGVGMPAS